MRFFSNPSVLTPRIFILVVYLGIKLISWEDLSVGRETQIGVDITAYWYFFLRLIVIKLRCIAASCEKFDFKKQTLFALLGILNLRVFNLLITENPFIFYILYEFLVIPIILIICF